jgi:nucleotide-binding universal stress UspA family protein
MANPCDKIIRSRLYPKNAGIGEDRYEIRVAETVRNVGKAIVEKASKEDFGTIVIGRSGMNRSFFMGSVSRYVFNRAMNRALWVVS